MLTTMKSQLTYIPGIPDIRAAQLNIPEYSHRTSHTSGGIIFPKISAAPPRYMYISATSENRGEVSGVASEIDLNVTQIIANVSATAKNVALREVTIKRRIRAPVPPRRSGANPAATIMPRVATDYHYCRTGFPVYS